MINEVDHNHPDHPDKRLQRALEEIKLATAIEIDSEGALVIYMPNTECFPPQKWKKHLEGTKKIFKEIFPDIPIIISSYEMKFTTITKKQVFSDKLAGNI